MRRSITVTALVLAACSNPGQDEVYRVQTAVAALRDLTLTVEATGEVEPIQRVEVKSKAGGEILRLQVDTGEQVESGTLLAEVDPRDVVNAHDQGVADLDVAKARLEIAEAQLVRSEELMRSEVIAAQEFESSKLEYANAQANLVRAETNLELAELRLGDVRIRAPISGTVLERNVEEGMVIQSASGNVSGGTTLFVMANLDRVRVRTLVDETDMGQLATGMPATVSVEAFPDRTFRGVVEKVEPQAVVDQNVTMFPVIVLLDNHTGLLKPGMNAEVEVLVSERRGTLAVPNNAVVEPQQLAPAAEVLGLGPDEYQLDRTVWTQLVPRGQSARGGLDVVGGPARQDSIAPRGRPGGATDTQGQRVSTGTEEDSPKAADASGTRGNRASGTRGGRSGTSRALQPERARQRAPSEGGSRGGPALGWSSDDASLRRGVAFVVETGGTIVARPVIMGLSDWDFAEIVAGLEEGEELALIGAAQLLAEQQARLSQLRGRRGGGPFR